MRADERELLVHVAVERGQSYSDYMREAIMAHLLADLECATREDALRLVRREAVLAKDL